MQLVTQYSRKLTCNGQVTVPESIRTQLNLQDGVVFVVKGNEVTLKRPEMSLDEVFNLADKTISGKNLSDEEMVNIAKEEKSHTA